VIAELGFDLLWMLAAAVCFLLAAISVAVWRLNLLALGAFFWALSVLI
jgi:hypothetical protein